MNYRKSLELILKNISTEFEYSGDIYSTDADKELLINRGNGLFLRHFINEAVTVVIEIESSVKHGSGLSIGPSHRAFIGIPFIESLFEALFDDISFYSDKGIGGFSLPFKQTCCIDSTFDWSLNSSTFKDARTFILKAIPFLQKHIKELEAQIPNLSDPIAIYEKMESFNDYNRLDSFVGGFTPAKRMLFKAWIKDPDFHGYSQRIMAIYKELIQTKGGSRLPFMLQAIEEAYPGCTKIFEEPRELPRAVTYNQGPDFYSEEQLRTM